MTRARTPEYPKEELEVDRLKSALTGSRDRLEAAHKKNARWQQDIELADGNPIITAEEALERGSSHGYHILYRGTADAPPFSAADLAAMADRTDRLSGEYDAAKAALKSMTDTDVDTIAHDVRKKSPDLTLARARVQAWEQHPDLIEKSRSALDAPPPATTTTISDRIRIVIDNAASEASWKPMLEQWGKRRSRAEIETNLRAELWRTREGELLKELDRARGGEPYTPTQIEKIRKNRGARFDQAFKVLETGISIRS